MSREHEDDAVEAKIPITTAVSIKKIENQSEANEFLII